MPDPRKPYRGRSKVAQEYAQQLARFCELDLDYAFGHLELAQKHADDPTLRQCHIDAAQRIYGEVRAMVVRLGLLEGTE